MSDIHHLNSHGQVQCGLVTNIVKSSYFYRDVTCKKCKDILANNTAKHDKKDKQYWIDMNFSSELAVQYATIHLHRLSRQESFNRGLRYAKESCNTRIANQQLQNALDIKILKKEHADELDALRPSANSGTFGIIHRIEKSLNPDELKEQNKLLWALIDNLRKDIPNVG